MTCSRHSQHAEPFRAAFTLVELLVASTIALTVMGALAALFGTFSRTASTSQAIVDMTNRMRTTSHRLRQDLAGVTVELIPWTDPSRGSGYFELIEGPRSDSKDASGKFLTASDIGGDLDDILLFTTRSTGEPFVGKFDMATVESSVAEVAWFCRQSPRQPVSGITAYNLYRKQFLLLALVGVSPFTASNTITGPLAAAGLKYDISLRREGGVLLPNSLSDLTKRENRFRHQSLLATDFPFEFLSVDKNDTSGALHAATFDFAELKTPERDGEDVILQNVLSFDVRVFDPDAVIKSGLTGPLMPGDPGYGEVPLSIGDSGSRGTYVDLGGSGNAPVAIASTFPPPLSDNLTAFQSGGLVTLNKSGSPVLSPRTYDTWSLHYESNGADENGNGLIDEGTDGEDQLTIDTNNDGIADVRDGIPDDPAERETSPPYPVPLRGIEVRIRCIEPTTKEIRQITIRHAFQ